MKKLMLIVGVLSFLFIGAVSIDSVMADQVYDDPPKKEVKSKDCSKKCPSAKTCCPSKAKAHSSKDKCNDKEDAKSAKVTNKNTSDTKKEDPDKK